MSEKYYTVDEIAEMIKIHPKTVQRYIREGKLRASKVGKGWRISGHDLSIFAEGIGIAPETGDPANSAKTQSATKISAVIDIPEINTHESIRIANTLTAALNSKPSEYGSSRLSTQYLMPENVLRIMIWGSLDFTRIMLDYIADLSNRS